MKIVLHPDSENDSCYISLDLHGLEAGAVKKSIRVSDDITVDFDSQDRMVGIDVMNASRRLPEGFGRSADADEVVGVKEAAEMAGLRRSNFVRDLANRDDFPTPMAELATGRVWLRSDLAHYLSERGQRPQKRTRRSA